MRQYPIGMRELGKSSVVVPNKSQIRIKLGSGVHVARSVEIRDPRE